MSWKGEIRSYITARNPLGPEQALNRISIAVEKHSRICDTSSTISVEMRSKCYLFTSHFDDKKIEVVFIDPYKDIILEDLCCIGKVKRTPRNSSNWQIIRSFGVFQAYTHTHNIEIRRPQDTNTQSLTNHWRIFVKSPKTISKHISAFGKQKLNGISIHGLHTQTHCRQQNQSRDHVNSKEMAKPKTRKKWNRGMNGRQGITNRAQNYWTK